MNKLNLLVVNCNRGIISGVSGGERETSSHDRKSAHRLIEA